jgi:hypothetical protein
MNALFLRRLPALEEEAYKEMKTEERKEKKTHKKVIAEMRFISLRAGFFSR